MAVVDINKARDSNISSPAMIFRLPPLDRSLLVLRALDIITGIPVRLVFPTTILPLLFEMTVIIIILLPRPNGTTRMADEVEKIVGYPTAVGAVCWV